MNSLQFYEINITMTDKSYESIYECELLRVSLFSLLLLSSLVLFLRVVVTVL